MDTIFPRYNETDSHEQFVNSFYKTMQQSMSQVEEAKKLFFIFSKKVLYIKSLKQKVLIEDNKHFHESYLLFPREWYLREIEKTEKKINRIIEIFKSKQNEQ